MNRLNHSLIAFLAVLAALVLLGLAPSLLGCREAAGVDKVLPALLCHAAVFRPSTQGGLTNGTP